MITHETIYALLFKMNNYINDIRENICIYIRIGERSLNSIHIMIVT
jgi:hypothetical protein